VLAKELSRGLLNFVLYAWRACGWLRFGAVVIGWLIGKRQLLAGSLLSVLGWDAHVLFNAE
jgi:hypothetical protein